MSFLFHRNEQSFSTNDTNQSIHIKNTLPHPLISHICIIFAYNNTPTPAAHSYRAAKVFGTKQYISTAAE